MEEGFLLSNTVKIKSQADRKRELNQGHCKDVSLKPNK